MKGKKKCKEFKVARTFNYLEGTDRLTQVQMGTAYFSTPTKPIKSKQVTLRKFEYCAS